MRVVLPTLLLLFSLTCGADIVPGEPPAAKGAATFVVLPDTQFYSRTFPQTYEAQVRWVLKAKDTRNVAAVLHLGDITHTNARPEWEVARRSMHLLHGSIPYFITTGNHDYGPEGNADASSRSTLLNEYFPLATISRQAAFGGSYDKEPERSENTYYLLEAAGRKWLFLALEFGPRDDVVRWANEVVSRHADRSAVLVTHAYLFSDSTRYDWKSKGMDQPWNPHMWDVAKLEGGVNDGEELWGKLVSKHANFVMTINGHVMNSGLGYLVSAGAAGQPVHQMLVNFQMLPNGGDGWLRLLEIQSDGKHVKVYDYSPTLDSTNTSRDNQFEFVLAPAR